jgi:hypothetical protein
MRLSCPDDEITPSVKQGQWHKCLTRNTVGNPRDRSEFPPRLSGLLRPTTQACGKNIAKSTIIREFLSNNRCGLMRSAFNNCQLWVMLGKSLGLTEDLAGMVFRNWLSVEPGGMQQQCQGATWRGSTTGSAIVWNTGETANPCYYALLSGHEKIIPAY